MKYIKLYENIDFEETWIDDPNLEIDISNVKLGKDGQKFKVLDKVISKEISTHNKIGYIIDHNNVYYLVYFIDNIGNTSGEYLNVPEGHGMWIIYDNLKKIE